MPRGGARNRSGPAPDEKSGRSERKNYSLTALPAEGYDGEVPGWPLPSNLASLSWDAKETEETWAERRDERERELWAWAWSTPQACAWSLPSEIWRAQSVARWVRQAVICESPMAKAADHGQLHRYADQIGLTTAGLREMGWKVAVDELGSRRASAAAPAVPAVPAAPRARRLRAAGDQ